jgi:two-component system NtrC family response regulator
MDQHLDIPLLDDEDIVHRTIGDYLRESGHRVGDAQTGAEGITMIQNNEWDLVLTDIRMPGMDGLSLLSRVQADHPDLSVVIITGHGNMDTAVQALRLGAADFLTKPIKLLELDAVLEKAVRLQGLRREKRLLRETVGRIQTSVGNRSLIGAGTAIKQVADQIQEAVEAACDTILITGDTGTGKEVVRRR